MDEEEDVLEKVEALYGEVPANLKKAMEKKHFKEIPEFLTSKVKVLTRDSVSKCIELS